MRPRILSRRAASVTVCLACLAAGSGVAWSRGPEVAVLDTQVVSLNDQQAVVRAKLEIADGAQKWFLVYFQVRLSEKTALAVTGNRSMLGLWGQLYPPANTKTALYDDVRFVIPTKGLATATNLPKGRRSVLWVVCDVWDPMASKYVAQGWDTRTPLLVTTNTEGTITDLSAFATDRHAPTLNDAEQKIPALKAKLRTKHARLRKDVGLYRAEGVRGDVYNVLTAGEFQANLDSPDRGFFFDRIDTPEKAVDFALVTYPGSVVIKTAEQYQAIAKTLREAGWKGQYLTATPPALDISVKEIPQLGYRVRATLVAYNYALKLMRGVVQVDTNVTYNGQFREKITRLITPPELPYGVPAGWEQPLPTGPGEYDSLIRKALTDKGSEELPPFVQVTDEAAQIPCARGESPDQYKTPAPPSK